MPASITHGYFALDIYDQLSKEKKELLAPVLTKFKMFSQGSDSLMFDFIPTRKQGKSGNMLQKFFHKTDTRSFFINLVTIIKRHHYQQHPEVLAYLYGSIAHYVLDSTIHPFIVFSTGYSQKRKPDTYKYNNLHVIMEAFLDMDMVSKRTKKNPYQFAITPFLFDFSKFSKELRQVIDEVYDTTYHLKHMSKVYQRSFKEMALCLRLFRYDKTGLKRSCYHLLDTITPKSFFRIDSLSYHVSLTQYRHFLNEDHEVWTHPAKKELISRESFQDLYDKSILTAIQIIHQVDRSLQGDDVDLTKVFDNRSYISGLDCNEKLNYQYFKF